MALLLDKFEGTLLGVMSSPYNTPYEISIYGITVTILEDNWPTPYLSAEEDDALVLERLVNDLERELAAIEMDD